MDLECLKCAKLVLGGDLNFSLGLSKIQGCRAIIDCLSNYFSKKMDDYGLVDIVLSVLLPTWSNRRVEIHNICKRLDRLMVSVDLLDFELYFLQWVGWGESDHQPVVLQILNQDKNAHSPFKFTAHWLVNEDLVTLLKNSWCAYNDNPGVSPAMHLLPTLNVLRMCLFVGLLKKSAGA